MTDDLRAHPWAHAAVPSEREESTLGRSSPLGRAGLTREPPRRGVPRRRASTRLAPYSNGLMMVMPDALAVCRRGLLGRVRGLRAPAM